jgi:hypothetical protein
LRIFPGDFSYLAGEFIGHTLISIQDKSPIILRTGIFKRPIPLFPEPFKLVLKKPDSGASANLPGSVGTE